MRFLANLSKGWFGERKTAFSMWLSLDGETYTRFHDVIIPASNGTTQIDHLLVSQYGLFIVETKNKGGWIFGDEKQSKWTQTFYRKKYSFQNPLRQTYRQKKVLAEFLKLDEAYIHDVVFFVGNCVFKTDLPLNVLNDGLGRYIKSFREPILSSCETNRIKEKLEKFIIESDLSTSDHVRSLRQRHGSITTCPKCGGTLIVKTAKKGQNAGAKFLACGNYPRCRFTRAA